MKYIFLCACFITFIMGAYAAENTYSAKLPEGVFKKSFTGKIIQYNKNGKKIGQYKYSNGRYYKVK